MVGVIGRMFMAASGLSLLLCIVTAALWVRSYWFADAVGRSTLDVKSLRYTCPVIVSQAGRVDISRTAQDFDRESLALWASDLRDSPSSIRPGLWHHTGRPADYKFKTLWDRFGVAVSRSQLTNKPYLGSQWFWSSGELHRRLQRAGRYSETAVRIEVPWGDVAILWLVLGFPSYRPRWSVGLISPGSYMTARKNGGRTRPNG